MGKARYVFTPARRAALDRARKKRKRIAKRGSFARKADKLSKSKSRTKRAIAYTTRGSGGKDSSIAYKISKRRGATKPKNRVKKAKVKAKKIIKKQRAKSNARRGSFARKADELSRSKSRAKRAAAYATRGSGGWDSSIAYKISKRRGNKKKKKSSRKKR